MYRVPNLAPQSLVAFASMVSNTGCRLPGELDMICSTSEVAACCSSASTSFYCTRVLAFALFERSTRACVLLFAPLRDKITSSAQSLVVLASASLDHLVGAQEK